MPKLLSLGWATHSSPLELVCGTATSSNPWGITVNNFQVLTWSSAMFITILNPRITHLGPFFKARRRFIYHRFVRSCDSQIIQSFSNHPFLSFTLSERWILLWKTHSSFKKCESPFEGSLNSTVRLYIYPFDWTWRLFSHYSLWDVRIQVIKRI